MHYKKDKLWKLLSKVGIKANQKLHDDIKLTPWTWFSKILKLSTPQKINLVKQMPHTNLKSQFTRVICKTPHMPSPHFRRWRCLSSSNMEICLTHLTPGMSHLSSFSKTPVLHEDRLPSTLLSNKHTNSTPQYSQLGSLGGLPIFFIRTALAQLSPPPSTILQPREINTWPHSSLASTSCHTKPKDRIQLSGMQLKGRLMVCQGQLKHGQKAEGEEDPLFSNLVESVGYHQQYPRKKVSVLYGQRKTRNYIPGCLTSVVKLPTGQATCRFVAMSVETRQLVFLKESWQPDVKGIELEDYWYKIL